MGWFLLVIGIALVVFNIRAIKKEKSSFNNIFRNTEEDMREFEVRLGEVRREFSETILELQKEIQELKKTYTNEINDAKDNEKIHEEINKEINKEVENDTLIENKTTNNSVKIEEINKLLVKGYSVEEISKRLAIGKGEVLLIKELYLK
jgi:hydroxymethylpyrimidine pyrophosphatase-like HAD family hydrolase